MAAFYLRRDQPTSYKKIKSQTYKPDSVLRQAGVFVIYLVPSRTESALPTPLAPETIETVRATQWQGVHGISTRKVYPPQQLPALVVRSYHTFSPLPVTLFSNGGK
jgi:hypothetical protein